MVTFSDFVRKIKIQERLGMYWAGETDQSEFLCLLIRNPLAAKKHKNLIC